MPTRATLVLNIGLTGRPFMADIGSLNAQNGLFRVCRSATMNRKTTGETDYGNAMVGVDLVLRIPERSDG
jgi:hypothetical protein